MGTRGLLGYIIRGKYRGTYNHFDSYPESLGTEIAEFLSTLSEEDRVRFIKRLNEIKWVSHDDPVPPETIEEYKAAGYHPRRSTSDEEEEIVNWDMLLGGVQGTKMFQPILEGKLRHMLDSTEFAADSLFCEWAYWVDFENERLDMYMYGRRCGVWTFAGMRVPQSYWWTMVENAKMVRRRAEERKTARRDKKRLVQKKYVYPDATKCRDAPSGLEDDDALCAGKWDSWSEDEEDDEDVVING
ncbi:hypothetical protein BDY19DRAFT_997092 [Irpex rosettiformis]|uniref:Uncharacterized protein n=1 Tax=Irpex rosettiformis TaxID=378272 RepID=A0ACB8TSS0_9APHY|nr:hypothetical protein BDY19DRAFT_997092 [Irpex rosettiformis]